jgi:hypothetical protein
LIEVLKHVMLHDHDKVLTTKICQSLKIVSTRQTTLVSRFEF